MQVEIKIDPSQPEPKVVITAASMTEEVNRIVRRLSEEIPQVISGTRDGKLEVLEPEELIRIYAASGKVFAVTGKGEYTPCGSGCTSWRSGSVPISLSASPIRRSSI